MSHEDRVLIFKAIEVIASGRANILQPLPQGAAAAQQRARELLPELGQQTLRPGILSEAQSTAEEFFRYVGRLRQDERLTDNLIVRVKSTDGRDSTVSMGRLQPVSDLQGRIGGQGGLILSGRPLPDNALLFDLWVSDGLGCTPIASPPYVQVTVRNVGG